MNSNKLLAITMLFVLMWTALRAGNSYIVFRFDDYGLTDKSFNNELFDVFAKAHVPLVVGVTPSKQMQYPGSNRMLDEEEVTLLKKYLNDGVIEVALHGYNHVDLYNPTNGISEFRCLPYELQKEKIKMGKEYLESVLGRRVVSFIPPFNSYDNNTLEALKDCGFEIISAARTLTDGSIKPYPYLLPATTDLFSLKKGLPQTRLSNEDKLLICLIHDYDFKCIKRKGYKKYNGGTYSFEELSKLLEYVKQKNAMATTFQTLNHKKLTGDYIYGSSNISKYLLYIPGFLRRYLSPQFISRSSKALTILKYLSILTIILYFIVSISLMTLGLILLYRWKPYLRFLVFLKTILYIVIILAIHNDPILGSRLRCLIYFDLSLMLTLLYVITNISKQLVKVKKLD